MEYKTKTNQDLERIATTYHAYSGEERYTALKELESRGELSKAMAVKLKDLDMSLNPDPDDQIYAFEKDLNISNDENLPVLYSKTAIYATCFLFSTFFSSILFSMNLKRLDKSNKIPLVIGLGLIYMLISIIILDQVALYRLDFIKPATVLLVGFGSYGSVLLWNKFIGKGFKHQKRNVILPVVVGILLATIGIVLISLGI